MEQQQINQTSEIKTYTYEEVLESSLNYFNQNDLSAKVFIDKYCLKKKENDKVIYYELNPNDMIKRISKEFARIEKTKFKNPLQENEIYEYLKDFETIIPQGSPLFGIGNKLQTVSLGNCFVISPPVDSYGGILKADEELVQISKRRGGIGTDLSNLRPNTSTVNNAAESSTGVVSFMSRYSNSIREVSQAGRRGALMLTLDIKHPESVILWNEEIDGKEQDIKITNKDLGSYSISSKYYNPNKVDFVTSKYDSTKVTGANISLRVSDEFMNSVFKDEDYTHTFPVNSTNPKVIKKQSAKKVWEKIIHTAWRTAEPGVLFWDNMIKQSMADCYKDFGFETVSTNPCGELGLSAFDSCRLLLLNLFGFVENAFTKDAKFNYEKFYQYCKIAQRLQDNIIDLEIENINLIIEKIKKDPESESIKRTEIELWENILENCKNGRRTGTGITALGDTIAALNLKYDSDESIQECEKIYKALKFACYEESCNLAQELGTFPIWNSDLEKENPFLNRFKNETLDLGNGNVIEGLTIYNNLKKYGRRNIAILTTAPAGSVSMLSKIGNYFGTSSGIEPHFSIIPYIRKRKINQSDKNTRVDSVDQNGDCWQNYEVHTSGIKHWMEITNENDINKSPYHNSTAMDLDWKKRVELQGQIQQHIDHSISSTLNLPEDVSLEKVSEIYETAYKVGCKGITIYRQNCRTGILVEKDSIKKKIKSRPETLKCDIHSVKIKGELWYCFIGKFEDRPYEIFTGLSENIIIPKDVKEGYIVKRKSGVYDLYLNKDNDNEIIFKHITSQFKNKDFGTQTRMISHLLRNCKTDEDLIEIINTLSKDENEDLVSFHKVIARVIKKYISDGVESTIKCSSCNETSLVFQEGCLKCLACGYSRCG